MSINWTNVEDQHPIPRKLLLFCYKAGADEYEPRVFLGRWEPDEDWARGPLHSVFSSLPRMNCHLWWAEMINLPEVPE